MTVWVVVPNHNGRRWLPGLIASLEAQYRTPDRVLVIDDASSDDSVGWLEGRGIDVLRRTTAGGFAASVNDGIRAAREGGAAAVALINTDVELEPDWLRAATDALESDAGLGSVATKMVRLDDPSVVDDAGNTLRRDAVCEQRGRGRSDRGEWDATEEIWGACAGAAVYRTTALTAVGGFDVRYGMYLEDVDLGLRLQLAGWRCRYVPAVARHAGGGSGAAVQYWVARNTLILVARWYPLRWLPFVAYRQCSWLVDAARNGKLRTHLRGLAAGFAQLPRVLLLRLRARDAEYGAVAAAIPARPWRGRLAGGHREAIE